ncbi:TetR/AcrR family transcriptional regulator [Nocardiopsis sp. CC223A]|uniref:TetR/AcrR family transcriptional regulator n=1 Tax=Nocardiopsis sp. CC223A TaxID=3044051 RepID=UPI00278C21C6|nr:TetR/AcrR family transcriptional regulator [Nocardiopsis sp. CC223A]
METKARLVAAAREPLWERGYAATSPRAVLDATGAGQGSMYHHFRGKEDLARAAVDLNTDEMRAQVDTDLGGPGPALDRLHRYLRRERDVLRGCRFGGLAQDPEAMASPVLAPRVEEMFRWPVGRLAPVVREAQAACELRPGLDADRLAVAIAAGVQGGYVLARATRDPTVFDSAVDGIVALLDTARTEP